MLVYRLVHFDDAILDIDIGLDGRDKELCKPLLLIAVLQRQIKTKIRR
jgi:hypothetical protein